jgi:predicted ATPase/DNA-binding SARP family transcriptional activator
LLLHPNQVVAAGDLIEVLWGDEAPRTARNVLQAHVATLRRALRQASEEVADRLETRGTGYRIRVEPDELDSEVFAAFTAEARRRQRTNPVAASELLARALGLWRGAVCGGVELSAVTDGGALTRLEDLRLGSIELRAELDLRLGRVVEVIGYLTALANEYPFRERFQALLMLALYRAGRQTDALATYRQVRTVLDAELGIEPGPELRALELAILRQDRELMADDRRADDVPAADDPGLAGILPGGLAGAAPYSLPAELTPFVGRDAELTGVLELLSRERLVTVTGAGGTGKTRFALHAASLALDSFPAGAVLVDLTPVPDGVRILPTIAAAVEAAEQGDTSLFDSVAAQIGHRVLLMVLDNCEHLIDDCAQLVERLLRAAPGLVVLATSREPLRLANEALVRLAPLSAPAEGLTRAELLASDAVRLFLDRATRVREVDDLSDADVARIAQICRRLDGLPLALEMAAARLRVLTPADVLDRLEDRFGLLTEGDRTAVARHQTIRATLDWSHDLLDPRDRATLRRMSVFVSAVPAGAVEAVCAGGDVQDPLDSAKRLADRSLVVANVGSDSRTHFGMLDTVRDYGRLHLRDSGEEEATFLAHIAHWTARATSAHRMRFDDPYGQAEGLEAVVSEMRVALDRAHRLEQAAELRLAGLLGWFWEAHTHLVEGRALLDRALTVSDGDPVDRARALSARGSLAGIQGDLASGRTDLEAALAQWRRLGERTEECATLDSLGWAAFYSGHDDGVREAFTEALAIATDIGVPGLVRRTSSGLCQYYVTQADAEKARPLAEELIRIAGDDLRSAHFGHHFLADCDLMDGDSTRALEGYRRSLGLAIRMGDAVETMWEVEGMGMASAGCGNSRLALRLHGAVAAQMQELGLDPSVPFWDALKDRYYSLARADLGPEGEAAWEEGRGLSMAEAIQQAMGAPVEV